MNYLLNNLIDIPLKISAQSSDDGLFAFFDNMFGSSNITNSYVIYLIIFLGILIISAVLMYNWWEEKQFNKEVESGFSTIDADALLDQSKQEFLNKFAGTTGHLSDEPAEGAVMEDDVQFDDSQSIEDVYKELMLTMEERKKMDVAHEETVVTVDHDSMLSEETTADPLMETNNVINNDNEILYIPEAETVEEISLTPDAPISKTIIDNDNGTAQSADMPHNKDEIKDIIHEAFKSKYNSNYKPDMGQKITTKIVSEDNDQSHHVEKVPVFTDNDFIVPNMTEDTFNTDHIDSMVESVDTPKVNIAEPADTNASSSPAEHAPSSHETPTQTVNTPINIATEPPILSEMPPNANGAVDLIIPPEATASDTNVAQQETPDVPKETVNPVPPIPDGQMNGDSKKEGASDTNNVPTVSQFTDALPASVNRNIDLIGTFELPNGVNAGFLLESFSKYHQGFDKSVFVHAQSSQDNWLLLNDATEAQISNTIQANQAIHLTASLQLADRTGAASKNTIQRFQSSFEAIAHGFNLNVNWKDNDDVLDKASALDALCIEVDKTMFFHIMHKKTGPFTGIKLKGLVEGQGMTLSNDGSFKYFDSQMEQLAVNQPKTPDFILFNRENHPFNPEMLRTSVVKAVTFQLDIPHVSTNGSALDRMIVIAKGLEDALGALLIDDRNTPLTDTQISKIRDQIKSIHATMQLKGITPGSAHAHRLFS